MRKILENIRILKIGLSTILHCKAVDAMHLPFASTAGILRDTDPAKHGYQNDEAEGKGD